jgi:hypothetical protein
LANIALALSSLTKDCGSMTSSANLPLEGICTTNASSLGSSGQSGSSSGTAWGRAEVGWLRLKALGSAVAQSPAGSWATDGPATAEAYWEDTLAVAAGPGLAGQPGELTATIVIDGSQGLSGGDPYAGTGLANGAGSYFFVQAKMNGVTGTYGGSNNFVGGTQLHYVSGGGTASSANSGNLIGPGTWRVTFPITFGQPGSLFISSKARADARAVVYSAADGLREGQCTSDFSNGVRWAGIAEVRATNGTVVTNYTVSATSGFDYAAGVSPGTPYFTRIDLVPQGVTLQWADSMVRPYTVETTGALPSTNWIPVPGLTWPITTNTITLPLQSGTNAFFRLLTQ